MGTQEENLYESHELSEIYAKAKWLEETIEKSISVARLRRSQNQRKASWVKTATIILSGLATIFLGLQLSGLEKIFKEIAFVFSALVTLMTAIEPFFNWRALWVEHESALGDFHKLLDDLRYYLAGRSPEELEAKKMDSVYEDYQNVWKRVSDNWIGHRQSNRFNT